MTEYTMESRKCIDCGKWHNTVIEDSNTKEILEYLDKCKDCIFKGCRYEPITELITIEALDKSEQPIADQMSKLYNDFISKNYITDKDKND